MPIPNPISWQSNAWHAVILDLHHLVADRVKALHLDKKKAASAMTVKRLAFRALDKEEPPPLHLQSVFVFSRWLDADTVRINGYDVSGVAGVTWQAGGHTDTMTVSPAAADPRRGGNTWLRMRVRDRAGNVSFPLRVPVVWDASRAPAKKTS